MGRCRTDNQDMYNYGCALVEDKIYIYGGNKIYIYGGNNRIETFDDLIEHDLVLNTLRIIKPTLNWPGRRAEMTAVWVPWRKEIVYFGGVKHSGMTPSGLELQNDTFTLNVDRLSWQTIEMKGTLPEVRRGHSAVLAGRSVFIYGGIGSRNRFLQDICVTYLSLTSPSWSTVRTKGRVPIGRNSPAFEHFAGKLLLYGGNNQRTSVSRNLDYFCLKSREWKNENDVELEHIGRRPDLSHAKAVSQCDAVVLFTRGGVYKLEFL